MEEHLRSTMFDPEIPRLMARIGEIARKTKGPELTRALESLVQSESEALGNISQRIRDDMMLNDFLLAHLGDALSSRLKLLNGRRQYMMTTKCAPCSESPKEKIREQSKQNQIITVDKYIYESDLDDINEIEKLRNAGYNDKCPACGREVSIVSSKNAVVPYAPNAVAMLIERVKSAGRRRAKLVDRMFYDEGRQGREKKDRKRSNGYAPKQNGDNGGAPTKKRSLIDTFGFQVVLNYNRETDPLTYYRLFREQFGVALPDNQPVDDAACYALLDILSKTFKTVDMTHLQDNIANPEKREKDGCVELFKMLQFPFGYQGKYFEGVIKTLATYEREQDRKSPLSHETWSEVAGRIRRNMFMRIPESEEVYKMLERFFPDRDPTK